MVELLEKDIKSMIYVVRGQQVMLDSDLARLYEIETSALNRAVKRNVQRFPIDFCFKLEIDEYDNLKCQIGISSLSGYGGRRNTPNVFTEQGVAMLSSVLHTEKAIQVSIRIINAFIAMRHYLLENKSLIGNDNLTNLVFQTNQNTLDIQKINTRLNDMATKDDISRIMDNFIDETKIKEFVFVDGQKFEADEAYISIYKQAKKSVYVVDDYISIKTLSHLKQVNEGVKVIVFTDNKAGRNKLTSIELNDFMNEYYQLELRETNNLVHDRLIVLDYGLLSEKIYLCGASSKDAGNKFCTILEVHHTKNYHEIINKLENNNVLVL